MDNALLSLTARLARIKKGEPGDPRFAVACVRRFASMPLRVYMHDNPDELDFLSKTLFESLVDKHSSLSWTAQNIHRALLDASKNDDEDLEQAADDAIDSFVYPLTCASSSIERLRWAKDDRDNGYRNLDTSNLSLKQRLASTKSDLESFCTAADSLLGLTLHDYFEAVSALSNKGEAGLEAVRAAVMKKAAENDISTVAGLVSHIDRTRAFATPKGRREFGRFELREQSNPLRESSMLAYLAFVIPLALVRT